MRGCIVVIARRHAGLRRIPVFAELTRENMEVLPKVVCFLREACTSEMDMLSQYAYLGLNFRGMFSCGAECACSSRAGEFIICSGCTRKHLRGEHAFLCQEHFLGFFPLGQDWWWSGVTLAVDAPWEVACNGSMWLQCSPQHRVEVGRQGK